MIEYLNLIAQAIATFVMTGAIWFVHLIHYPLLKELPEKLAVKFEQNHWKRALPLATFTLVVELLTAILLFVYPPMGVNSLLPLIGLILLAIIWASTWFVCVPYHYHLKDSYENTYVKKLLYANRLRAILWALRTIIVSMILYSALVK